MLTLKVAGVEGGREPACSEFPSTFRVSIVPTQRQFTLNYNFSTGVFSKDIINFGILGIIYFLWDPKVP